MCRIADNSVKSGHVVSEICVHIEIETDMHITLVTMLCHPTGG